MSIDELQRTWDELARRDPYWAILTDPEKTGNRWDVEEFLGTGVRDVREALDHARSLGVELRYGSALDFGCGAGRLTQALADHFEQVHGVDISPRMVELARRLNSHRAPSGYRCTFHLNARPDLQIFPADSFDFVYSRITLQHIPPRFARAYIREFLRVLRPGGLADFQMPSSPLTPERRFGTARRTVKEMLPDALLEAWWTRRHNRHAVMAMWWIELPRMARFLRHAGAEILDIRKDGSAGEGWESYRYCVIRR